MSDYQVYLKLQNYSGTDVHVDTIPLRVTNISIAVDKTIPSFPIPLSGLATGESTTVALDLGMSNKRVSLTGFIVDTDIKRSHTKSGGSPVNLNFTAQEIAQLIASGVDSTGLAKYQAFNELVFLIPSKVDKDYAQRVATDIPFTFKSRGNANRKDNKFVAIPSTFPNTATDEGLKGFVSSFSCELAGETIEISFSLEFTVANVLP